MDPTSDRVKKRIRQLLLLVHPDKNVSPLAEEAFDMVNTAARVLTDSWEPVAGTY